MDARGSTCGSDGASRRTTRTGPGVLAECACPSGAARRNRGLQLLARTAALASVVVVGLALPGFAAEPGGSPDPSGPYVAGAELGMLRFEFDNDSALDSDDAFTAGWSLQAHSGLQDEWHGPLASLLAKSGLLGDDGVGGRVVRRSFGITQLMSTPQDLAIVALQPEDVPYAGVLGVHGSWAAYDNRRLTALQLYVGCMGPNSGAEQVQKFVHNDMNCGPDPKGWDNQLDTKWLANVNLAWKHKLFAAAEGRYQPGRRASDLSVGGQLGVGNAARYVDAQLEYRVGWGLPMGFTHVPDPAPRGVVLDPVYLPAGVPATRRSGWRAYLSVVLRGIALDDVVVREGGPTQNGLHHPGASGNDVITEGLAGLHVGRTHFAFHATYVRMLSGEEGVHSDADWINLSLERRL